MKPFLILGQPGDLHAGYVAWALRETGYETTFINSSHDSCPMLCTLYIDRGAENFGSVIWEGAEAVWRRRISLSTADDKEGGKDEEFVRGEEERFTTWLIDLQESCPIRWVNPATAGLQAENKFIQLKAAKSYGIVIPRTLVTTQPERFRAFLRAEGKIVAKPLGAFSWEIESGEESAPFAVVVDAARGADLADEEIARCVTMYQELVDKVDDVRVVVLGEDFFAYRALQNGEQHFDYRLGFFQENYLRFEAIPFPAPLRSKMIELMKSLNLNFASADFALQRDGEWVFLDLNPNGQWLFIDRGSPEARIGQKFCSFFVHGKVQADADQAFPSFAEYCSSMAIQLRTDAADRPLVARAN